MLGETGLAERARVIVEKPFGTDLASAEELNASLHAVFGEADVFRIDHFLGKESIENILALRFANGLFEPIWNRDHVDHVQIDVPETLTVAGRSGFYEQTGAFRDMVVTHLFQVLGFIAMEPPTALTQKAVRNETAKVFDSMKPLDPSNVVRVSTRDIGTKRASTPSRRRRRSSLEVEIDNWRWAGVPFFLRTGKSLAESCQVITLAFHEPPLRMFTCDRRGCDVASERARHRVPGSGIDLRDFLAKPGADIELREVAMQFDYDSAFEQRELEATSASCTTRCSVTRPCSRAATASSGCGTSPRPGRIRRRDVRAGSWGPESVDELIAPRSWHLRPAGVMSDRALQALITVSIGLALLLALRVVLGAVFERYVKRVAARKPPDYVARLHTRLMVLRRVIIAFVSVVVLWSVLEIFPATERSLGAARIRRIRGVDPRRRLQRASGTSARESSSAQPAGSDRRSRNGRRRDRHRPGDHAHSHDREDGPGPHRVRAQLTDDHVDGRQQVARRSSPARHRAPTRCHHGTARRGTRACCERSESFTSRGWRTRTSPSSTSARRRRGWPSAGTPSVDCRRSHGGRRPRAWTAGARR